MKKRYLISIVIILQLIFLSSMILFHQVKLKKAKYILLETVPYDPKSIFRGHYVDLRYKISTLPVKLLKDVELKDLKGADELFVILEKKDKYWEAKGVYQNKPKDKPVVFVRGRLPNYMYHSAATQKNIRLEYGIEAFFLNEVAAKDVEDAGRRLPWRQRQRLEKERIEKLDAETRRIHTAGISQWNFDTWKKEFPFWVKQGIITQETKDILVKKYSDVLEKIKKAKDVEPASQRKPIMVQIAVCKDGYAYPVKMLVDGKEYR